MPLQTFAKQGVPFSVGSLEVGKEADIAVWDRDPYTIPSADLKNMKCVMTIFNGRVIYE